MSKTDQMNNLQIENQGGGLNESLAKSSPKIMDYAAGERVGRLLTITPWLPREKAAYCKKDP